MAPGLPQPPELRCRAEAGFKGTLHPNTACRVSPPPHLFRPSQVCKGSQVHREVEEA